MGWLWTDSTRGVAFCTSGQFVAVGGYGDASDTVCVLCEYWAQPRAMASAALVELARAMWRTVAGFGLDYQNKNRFVNLKSGGYLAYTLGHSPWCVPRVVRTTLLLDIAGGGVDGPFCAVNKMSDTVRRAVPAPCGYCPYVRHIFWLWEPSLQGSPAPTASPSSA